ncbi:MAG: 4Fe-4S binding protein, partial [Methanosarcinaceae archaeon]|nr:4Fe-4S binding protein [Methanosarcinaceae archaeon]
TVPSIDGTACTGCGVCVNVCPTGAFALRDISKENIISSIEEGKTVVFSCRTIEKFDYASYVPVPCIGYLCEGILIKAASVSEKVILNGAGCDHCKLKIDMDTVQRKINLANTVLGSFGKIQNLELSVDSTGDAPTKDAFGRKSIDYLRNMTGDGGQNSEPSGESSIIPVTHMLLIDAISSLDEPVDDVIKLESGPLYNFDIMDACNLCGICAAMCPTGALRLSEDKDRSIEFNISFCIGCDLCKGVCKSDAIDHVADISLSDVISSDWISLISSELVQCKRCKRYIASINKDDLCPSCSLEQDIERQFLQ